MAAAADNTLFGYVFISCLVLIVVLFVFIYWLLRKKCVQVDAPRNLMRLSLALFPVILIPFLFSPMLTRNNKILLSAIGLGVSTIGFLAADSIVSLLRKFSKNFPEPEN